MTITLGTPTLLTQAASENFSQSYSATGGGGVLLICSERGAAAGTSPSSLTYGGVDVLSLGTAGVLGQIAASQRGHRMYFLAAADAPPGSGSRTVTMSWLGADNTDVAIIEVFASGEVTVADAAANTAGGSVSVTAGADD